MCGHTCDSQKPPEKGMHLNMEHHNPFRNLAIPGTATPAFEGL